MAQYSQPFAPKKYSDFVISDPASKRTLDGILAGSVPFPGKKCAICFHGAYGTGKTSLARLLPGFLEASKHLPEFPRPDSVFGAYNWEHFTGCGLAGNTVNFVQNLVARVNDPMLAGPTGWHYETFDEVDLLTPAAQASLKTLCDPLNGTIFIFTTNYLNKVDKALLNRSHLIEMNHPSHQQYEKLGRQWFVEAGLTGNELTPAQWKTLISSCRGSVTLVIRCRLRSTRSSKTWVACHRLPWSKYRDATEEASPVLAFSVRQSATAVNLPRCPATLAGYRSRDSSVDHILACAYKLFEGPSTWQRSHHSS